MSKLDFSTKGLLDKEIVAWEGRSFHIVSLLDMLRVYAAHFVKVCNLLADLRGIIKTLEHSGKISTKFTPEILDNYLTRMDWLFSMLTEMQLKMSIVTAEKISKHLIKTQRPDKELSNLISVLNDRVFDELNTRLVFIISLKEEMYYNPEELIFGNEIADKFPNMVEDIVEAGNCFACNRYTACVFHLMRVMEMAVQKLADKLGLPLTLICDKEWQIIINDIRGQLKLSYPKHADPDRIKYEHILGHLETIKIAWRNPTMHPKMTYTEEEGKAILTAVEIFLKDLVKVLYPVSS